MKQPIFGLLLPLQVYSSWFLRNQEEFLEYKDNPNIVVIASPGRSGSTMLTQSIVNCSSSYRVLKTHCLPPQKDFKGKILFIYSDPNKAVESVFSYSLRDGNFGKEHFINMEGSDLKIVLEINMLNFGHKIFLETSFT